MADVDGVAQAEVLDDRGDVGGVVVHVVALAYLARTAVAAPVVGDDAEALSDEEQQLRVPVVGTQRPAMMEHDWLRVLRAPVLVVDLDSVFGADETHRITSIVVGSAWAYTRAAARLSQASKRVGAMRGLGALGLRPRSSRAAP